MTQTFVQNDTHTPSDTECPDGNVMPSIWGDICAFGIAIFLSIAIPMLIGAWL
jgi:hypothetical protein